MNIINVKENQLLAKISMITFLGDYISLFAILLILEKSGFSPEYTGVNIIFQAIAFSLSAFLYPYLSSRFTTKKLIIISQIVSFFASSVTLLLYTNDIIKLIPFVTCTFILTFCYQIFDNAKNHHSKLLNLSNDQHSNNEFQILSYFFSSQTFGPIISILLINIFPLSVPLLIDIFTFIVCIVLAFNLNSHKISSNSFFKPFIYIWKFPKLRDITLLRSIGFWIGAGIFDYLMFPAVRHKYGVSVTYIAYVYACLGCGASLGIATIRNPITGGHSILKNIPMWVLASIGNLGMALTMFLFWSQRTFMECLFISFIHGVFMGILAASTQSIRKIESTTEQFPEIMSMEIMLGRLTAFIIPFIIFSSITTSQVSYELFKYIPAVSSFILAMIYFLRFRPSKFNLKN